MGESRSSDSPDRRWLTISEAAKLASGFSGGKLELVYHEQIFKACLAHYHSGLTPCERMRFGLPSVWKSGHRLIAIADLNVWLKRRSDDNQSESSTEAVDGQISQEEPKS